MSLQNKIYSESKTALDSMKTEIANELGLTNYAQMDKGNPDCKTERLRWWIYDEETCRNG